MYVALKNVTSQGFIYLIIKLLVMNTRKVNTVKAMKTLKNFKIIEKYEKSLENKFKTYSVSIKRFEAYIDNIENGFNSFIPGVNQKSQRGIEFHIPFNAENHAFELIIAVDREPFGITISIMQLIGVKKWHPRAAGVNILLKKLIKEYNQEQVPISRLKNKLETIISEILNG